jgi:hypothetical protein
MIKSTQNSLPVKLHFNGVQERLNLNGATYKTSIVVGFVVVFVVVTMTSSAQLMDDLWLEEVGEVRLPV